MTDEMMNLRAHVEKVPDADILRKMIAFRRAADGDRGRGEDRRDSRRAVRGSARPANGYRDRDWETRAGNGGTAHLQAVRRFVLSKLS